MTLKGILILFAAIGLIALAIYWLRTLPSKPIAPKPTGNRSVLFKNEPNDDGR